MNHELISGMEPSSVNSDEANSCRIQEGKVIEYWNAMYHKGWLSFIKY